MSEQPSGHRTGNLPPVVGTFVGRRAELTWLRSRLELDDGEAAKGPVSLVGAGGVGKTRLALDAAGRAAGFFPDGVWLVELSPLRTPGLVGLAVLEALRLGDQSTSPVTEVVADWAADKRLLLILDSCEHVLADCVALVETLLPALPGLRVLVTSREPLGLPAEQVLRVDPLPVPDDAVALFADRAAAADPGFVLDEAATATATAVCERLDGIPLAIELAAARLGELSLDELHGRLGERLPTALDILTSDAVEGPVEGPARHRTLRTAIGWSHELCAPLERLLWARLSVFAGGFHMTAVEEICTGGPLSAEAVDDLLARLVEQSIVLPHRTDPERFRLPDTVREFGADWLRELGEEQRVRLLHRDHYRRLAREGCAAWNTARQTEWCERTLREHANLRAAMDCALAEPHSAVALETAADIGFLWRHCGYLRDAQHCLDQVLAGDGRATADAEDSARARALWVRGAVALLQGDLDGAGHWAALCADAARELGDPVAVVAAASLTGGHLSLTGRVAEAVGLLASVPRIPVQGDVFGAAQLQTRLALSFCHLLLGEFDAAREVAREVRTAGLELGECWTGAFAECFVAQADLGRGDVLSALRNARGALAGHALLHNTVGAAMALDVLAAAAVEAGEGDFAARLLGIGQRAWEFTGRAQLNSPDLIATRRTHELRVRALIGDAAYDREYEAGRAMPYQQGLEHAAKGQ
ncbi:ATP-binding protein [Streptomyces sp. NPDC059786]|uniref:ATP-binding protein n=1 Tax=Streptomyces sp. NPDC059786 TaxID=3346946 RepID=UPI003663EFAA